MNRSLDLRTGEAKTMGYLAMSLFDWSQHLSLDTQSDVELVSSLRNMSVTAFEKAFSRGFHPPNVLHSRASLALEAGDFQVAVQFLDLALQETAKIKSISGDAPVQDLVFEPFTYNQLGVAYERLARDDLAENAYLKGY